MKRTRLLSGLALGTAAVLTLAGCSTGASGDDTDGVVTLDFFMDKAAWEPTFDAMNEVSEKDEQMTLEVIQTPGSDAGAYDSFVKQAFQTKDVPDLFTWHTGESLGELVERDLVAETTDIWTEAEKEGLVPEGLKDNYTFDGKQYCVPLNVVYWAMYYNKHVFEEHGIEVPTTFEELMDAAVTLKAAGVTPFHQMNVFFEFVWFMALAAGEDPEAYAALGTDDGSFLDPSIVESTEQWKQMMDDGWFIDPGVQTDPQTLLSTGEVAMAYFGTFLTGQLTAIDQVAGEDYGIFTFPNMNADVEDTQMVLETGPLCVGKGADNEKAALEYSKWWLGDDAQTVWTETRGDVSFNPNAPLADPELQNLVDTVNGGGYQIQPRFMEMVPLPVYNRSTEVFGEFVSNNGDPDAVLEELQKENEAYWSEQD
ncbi:ABC transporter substrate-binding protein [Microbacterium sp. TWP3-1-2b2]|uniref:ABC transporter substrate-binding protein n=1 Tax=Microbacterium sp. TWP3-1-2b2 TaxID=2804651 RepID=UPI003CF1FDDE